MHAPRIRAPRRRLFPLLSVLVLVAAVATTALVSAGAAGADTDGNALFGLYPGENNIALVAPAPAFTYADNYLPAMVAWQGRNNGVINIYNQIHGQTGADTVIGYAGTIWDTYHSVPMISLNTNNWTNAQVVAGSADADIDYYADHLRDNYVNATINGHAAPDGGRRVYIRLDWEMNANFSPWEVGKASNCTTLAAKEAEYVQMWQHFHDEFMSEGGFDSTQVAWVYSVYEDNEGPSCTGPEGDYVAQTYPGDDYVDWVGIDGYAFPPTPNGAPYETPGSIFDTMLTELRGITSKPVSIDEVGAATHGTGAPDAPAATKDGWIADYFDWVETNNIGMTLWFNIDLGATGSLHSWAVFCNKNGGLADPYCKGNSTYVSGTKTYNVYPNYKTGVDSTYFTEPDTGNPRLLTDTQFLGTA